ncbi:putative secreted protein (Por secretion system target) [Winogradskyella eximia]|uniref:Putative secreted protein (Por secretion system target) n=1 Tax=Winogradskyella eximia TaxID=262006 RepID=A0A3D9HCH0_9FLAO|nr:T9SS type A sorting domain-containing protein [Winogradskyella eximia]RED46931.1 putative secreted protein (Por secretion system target) [Winogradskyella eximia]
MKKQLLFTAVLLFASLLTFGQAYVLDATTAAPRARVADTNFTESFTSGTIGTAGSGAHVNWSDATVVNGTISFDVVSSGADFNASIALHVRKRFGNSGSVDFTVDGTTETFPLASDATATNLDAYEIFNPLTFSQNVTISSVPTTITLDVNNVITDLASDVSFRYYNVTFTNVALSVDDFETQDTSVKVYPNPTKNSFRIDSNKTIESVELYNITGQLLKTFSEEANYDISDLATGIYIANIKTQLGSKTLRIVKE